MNTEDKITKAASLIIKGFNDPKNTAFKKDHVLSLSKVYDFLFRIEEVGLLLVEGNSMIAATVHEHEFVEEKFLAIVHFYGGDRNGSKLLKEVEDWGRVNGAVVVTNNTMFNKDERIVRYYESKGYSHVGYSFNKYL